MKSGTFSFPIKFDFFPEPARALRLTPCALRPAPRTQVPCTPEPHPCTSLRPCSLLCARRASCAQIPRNHHSCTCCCAELRSSALHSATAALDPALLLLPKKPDPLLHQIPLPPAAPNPRCLHACTLCQHHDPAPSLAAPLLLCLCTLQQLQTNWHYY
ncbi:hypothetical protein SLEP1_g18355 [Rubroshorea leprosula]|uniref:Uncharacterized protein n=1 Tax=Rubroshorea leprosula TaxID=152421 RepID=A0AAV5IX54_9ROSI|nr:hypothetical protein SLEP1_g18355 [Rubroshorea leprosula]